MPPLAGKVLLVTGGASGIGAATATRLAADGAAVVVGDVDGEGAAAVAAGLRAAGGRAVGRRCDMADESEIAGLVDAAVSEFGGLDGWDHNAAWTSFARDLDAERVDLDVWDRVLRVNTRGGLLLARHGLPHLRARGGGSVVHISSGSGTIGEATRVAYGVSKAAVDQLTRHLAARYGRHGVRANSVAPGFVLTATARRGLAPGQLERLRATNPSGRLGRPEDVAAVVAFLLSDDAAYVNGQTIHVDGGVLAVGRLAADSPVAEPGTGDAQPPSAPAAS